MIEKPEIVWPPGIEESISCMDDKQITILAGVMAEMMQDIYRDHVLEELRTLRNKGK